MWSAANMLQFPWMNHNHDPEMGKMISYPLGNEKHVVFMVYAYIYITNYIIHHY